MISFPDKPAALDAEWKLDGNGLVGPDGVLVSFEAATRLFEAIRADPGYLWEFIDDCCLARAHKMCAALTRLGVYSEKIRADNARGTWLGSYGLAVRREGKPDEFIFMGFHIAPLVRVRPPVPAHAPVSVHAPVPVHTKDGPLHQRRPPGAEAQSPDERKAGFVEMVLDPALFQRPVSVAEWAARLINRDSIRPDGVVDATMQEKDFCRLPHDVFEQVLYRRNRDDGLEKTEAMLAAHRWEYERARRAACPPPEPLT